MPLYGTLIKLAQLPMLNMSGGTIITLAIACCKLRQVQWQGIACCKLRQVQWQPQMAGVLRAMYVSYMFQKIKIGGSMKEMGMCWV